MKILRNAILLFVLVLFFSCLKNKESNHKIDLKQDLGKENNTSQKVVISGKTDDPKAFEVFNLSNDSYLFGREHKDAIKEIFKDSLHYILDSINKPQLMEVLAFGEPPTFYRTRLFVSPGDTISFIIRDKKMKFTGRNAPYNNFFIEIENLGLDYGTNPYLGEIITYKQSVKAIYDNKVDFFNEYVKGNKITSNDYITIVREDLKFEYLNNLISPRATSAGTNNMYFNTFDGLNPIIEKEYANNDVIFSFKDYFDDVTIEDFKKHGLQNSYLYKNSLSSFIRHYFDTSEYIDYSKEKLLAEKEFIQKNLDGELEDYAIARMISDYNNKGFGYSTNNIELMKSLIDEYEDKFTKPSYKERMLEIKENLNSFNFELSDAALDTKLISQFGDTLTLKEIFSRSSKRIRVIDFWASWCPPCIDEITKAKSFKDKLSIENNVEWIYLSIDKDKTKWLQKSSELKEFLNVRNQFLILRGQNSSLANSLKVKGIPRYVILNKENKIVLNNAPKPSDSLIFKKIFDKIN